MSLSLGSDLKEAKEKLDRLEAERLDVQDRLSKAIEEGDADSIINLEARDKQLDVELFAARAKVLKLRRSDVERLRIQTRIESEAIEAELNEATKVYVDLVNQADEARQRMQLLQVKAYGTESKINQLREDGHELDEEIKFLVNDRIERRYEGLEAKA